MSNPSEIARGNMTGEWVLALTLSPAAVAATTVAEQTFTLTGAMVGDFVEINKPTTQAGLGIVNSRISANGVLAIAFVNLTGSSLTPTSGETYLCVVSRAVNVSAGLPTLTQIT